MATLEQIESALRKADAAGNVEDARRLAAAYRQLRDSQKPADFSGVQTGSASTQNIGAPQKGNSFTRALGEVGGRQVLEGAAGLMGALGGDAINHYVMQPLGLSDGRTYKQAASDYADSIGMRSKDQYNASERVNSDIAEGLAGTAMTMGAGGAINAGRGAVGAARNKLAEMLTTQPALQVGSTVTGSGASSIARESGASEPMQAIAGLAGAIAPGAAGTTGAATVRGLVRGRSVDSMRNAIADFSHLGATPSIGQASGNRFIQAGENLLAGAPTSAGVMNRFAERQADSIGSGLQKVADDFYRNASGERAGRAIERGVDTATKNIKAMRQALYWQADRYIPANTPMSLQNTQTTLNRLITPTQGATATTGALINPKIQQMAQNIADDMASNGGALPYEAVKALRSKIGEELSDFSLVADKPTAQYKQLYGALSQDMEEAAQRMGPEAVKAAKRANLYMRVSANRLENIERVVDKNGGPEKVFNAVMSGTKDGGTTLRAVMQSLPEDGQKAVTAAVIKRMGLATPGVQDAAGETFSAQTFLTNWNRVSPEARRALFDRYGSGFSKSMDRIASVAQNIRDGAKVYSNPSGTANRVGAYTYGAGLIGSIVTGNAMAFGGLALSGAASAVVAKALTSPTAVNWMATVTGMPKGAIPAAINSLRNIGEKREDQDLIDFANTVEALEKSSEEQDNANYSANSTY